jgi:hypothetical protein
MNFSKICDMFRRGLTLFAGYVWLSAIAPINAPLALVISAGILIIALYPYDGGKFLP